MNDFAESNWADDRFSGNYVEKADVFIMDRQRMYGIVAAVARHTFRGQPNARCLDLGAGDGVLSRILLAADDSLSLTLVDASETMLARAREKFAGRDTVRFVNADFDTLVRNKTLEGPFDLCVSSLAIHHLDAEGKEGLFAFLFDRLAPGGSFVNVDVVLPPTQALEEFYFDLWRAYMSEAAARSGFSDIVPDEVIRSYKDPKSMNRPDTLGDQLAMLKAVGYVDVDCYYKNAMFAVYGGRTR